MQALCLLPVARNACLCILLPANIANKLPKCLVYFNLALCVTAVVKLP